MNAWNIPLGARVRLACGCAATMWLKKTQRNWIYEQFVWPKWAPGDADHEVWVKVAGRCKDHVAGKFVDSSGRLRISWQTNAEVDDFLNLLADTFEPFRGPNRAKVSSNPSVKARPGR